MPARVLVVDDVLLNVKLLEAKLSKEYFDVLSAYDGPEALRVIEENRPDLILLDVMMPGMDGFEVCRRIRGNPATMHLPVVMVTALTDPSDRVKGLEAGADDFLTKPVDDVALFARVRSLLRLKMMMDEWLLREQTSQQLAVMDAPNTLNAIEFRGASILLVEDKVIDSTNFREALRADAHTIEDVATVEEGLEAAGRGNHDLIVCSLNLSGGVDVLRMVSQLRSLEKTRQITILMIGESTQVDRLAKALDLGINDYVTKPFDRNELIARVRTQIRRRRFQALLRQSYEASVSLALTDSLTGLYNRRYLLSYLQGLMEGEENRCKPLCILLIDVDHFKLVNDTHGHAMGDKVLRSLADNMTSNLRNMDMVARIGGEEFVVVMPDTNIAVAGRVASRLLGKVAAEPVAISDGLSIPVTVSIGIAMLVEDVHTVETFLALADGALYKAKRQGRNQVVLGE
ncbi:MAG: PleD family two-component system response regulator [Alphaproteobacteria bacterium]|nr:PleD family two-component system response regulator [Alphaproteobacteria bacterium]